LVGEGASVAEVVDDRERGRCRGVEPSLLVATRFDASQGPRIVGPSDGTTLDLGSCGARLIISGEELGGGVSLVEHPIRRATWPLRSTITPGNTSTVLEGRPGALLGDDLVYAEIGDLVFKPREQWHTFWNAGDTTCRILELISPAGFEHYFEELAEALGTPEDRACRYGTETDHDGTRRVCREFGLQFPPPPSGV
jgi:hypothetical protein